MMEDMKPAHFVSCEAHASEVVTTQHIPRNRVLVLKDTDMNRSLRLPMFRQHDVDSDSVDR